MTDHVALYLPTDPPELDWLRKYPEVTDAQVTEWNGGVPAQYNVKFLHMTLIISVMSLDQVPEHLQGFANYVASRHFQHKSEKTVTALEQIAKVKTVLGCVIQPELDSKGYMGGLLTSLVNKHQGLMFARDCVFNSDGEPLIEAVQ